jgi:hypothetical protein
MLRSAVGHGPRFAPKVHRHNRPGARPSLGPRNTDDNSAQGSRGTDRHATIGHVSTAEAIAAMTDDAEFEILGTRVLRLLDPDCVALEHSGVNAAGKTIASAVDGYCRVPNVEPPRFVTTQFTTCLKGSLRTKWINERDPESSSSLGDLLKAAHEAGAIRRTHPFADFVVYLCSNKQPDVELLQECEAVATKLNVKVRFLTLSRLRDFLDVDPDGQWLRRQHLGIAANRISRKLLVEIGLESLRQLGATLLSSTNRLVATETQRDVARSVTDGPAIHVLIGESGSGKSVTAFQVLSDHLTNARLGIWMPAALLERSSTLSEALHAALTGYHPCLTATAGHEVLALLGSGERFLIVVDDVNRLSNPSDAIRTCIRWSGANSASANRELSSSHATTFLVPAWSQSWAPLKETYRNVPGVAVSRVGTLSKMEAVACVRECLAVRDGILSDADCYTVAASLAFDPILIALFAQSFDPSIASDPSTFASDAVGRFSSDAINEASATSQLLPAELQDALLRSTLHALKTRDLYPTWDELCAHLPAESVSALRALAKYKKLCELVVESHQARFVFRHDRILAYFASGAISRMSITCAQDSEVMADPYYAQFVGDALAGKPLTDEEVAWLVDNAPLALVSCLRHVEDMSTDVRARVTTAAREWFATTYSNRATTSETAFHLACTVLSEIFLPVVLDVTSPAKKSGWVAYMRCANGDCLPLMEHLSRAFDPTVHRQDLEDACSRAMHRHKPAVVAQVAARLRDPTASSRDMCGAFALAGYLRDPALDGAISDAWGRSDQKAELLFPALWAALFCVRDSANKSLASMIEAWSSLPDDEQSQGDSPRQRMSFRLQHILWRDLPPASLTSLLAAARTNIAIRNHVVTALEWSMHPDAVQFVVERAGELQKELRQHTGSSMWLWIVTSDRGLGSGYHRKPLPPSALTRVKAMADDLSLDADVRSVAFACWVSSQDDLAALSGIQSDHPGYLRVVQRRARLGDLTVAPTFATFARDNPYLLQTAAKVWSAEVRALVVERLGLLISAIRAGERGREPDIYVIPHLLRDIPTTEAASIIEPIFSDLRTSTYYVQLALYLGTERLLAEADAAIHNWPVDDSPFEHLMMFFGSHTVGVSDRLSLRHFETLRPYLSRLSEMDLKDMADTCRKRGWTTWAREHLQPVLAARAIDDDVGERRLPGAMKKASSRRNPFPSDDDLSVGLDEIAESDEAPYGLVHFWCDDFDKRQDPPERRMRVLREWLMRHPDLRRLRVVASALGTFGTRKDLAILDYPVSDDEQNIADDIRREAALAVKRRTLR